MNTPPPPPLPPPPSLALDDRGREIFREIVDAYLKTGEPVGSRTLSKLGASGLSAASIRNTMADLAALGLLDAPHAMAGRRPTQAGLRFFLDTLLQVSNDPPEEDQAEIEARIAKAGRGREEVLAAASDLLSGLAGGAGLVVTAQREAPVRHFEFVSLSPSQALAVFVFEDNAVENRLVELPVGLTPSALTQASNFLNAHLKGRTLAEARQEAGEALQAEKTRLDELAAKLVSTGLVEWGGEDPLQGRALIVRGRAKLLSDARAQEDLSRITQLFEDLEQAQNLVQILDLAGSAESVRIFLGSENPIFSLTGSSTIVKPYVNAQRQVVGALGVIGPTRLNYARIIPVVDYTARVVSRVLDPERS